MKWYVSMIDTFMSNWGASEGKENVLVFECDTFEEMEIVEENANNRSDMTKVKTHSYYPQFNENKFFVQDKDKQEYPKWYQKGAF